MAHEDRHQNMQPPGSGQQPPQSPPGYSAQPYPSSAYGQPAPSQYQSPAYGQPPPGQYSAPPMGQFHNSPFAGMQMTPELAEHQANVTRNAATANRAMNIAFPLFLVIFMGPLFFLIMKWWVVLVFAVYGVIWFATRKMRKSQQGWIEEVEKVQRQQARNLRQEPWQ